MDEAMNTAILCTVEVIIRLLAVELVAQSCLSV